MSDWAWLTNTSPFSAIDEARDPAHFVVEQISDNEFSIPKGQGFQYNGSGSVDPIVVTNESLPRTDFASIPPYMSWFVSRYGRHTPAALVHDQLVRPGMDIGARKQADRFFLEMLDSLDVPPVRSRVMWAAVTLATRVHGSLGSVVGLVLWGIAAAGGIALLVFGLVSLTVWAIVLALVGPALGAVLWGRQIWAGMIAGYALPAVVLPALASLLGYWVYWAIETAVRVGRKALPHNRSKSLAKPVSLRKK